MSQERTNMEPYNNLSSACLKAESNNQELKRLLTGSRIEMPVLVQQELAEEMKDKNKLSEAGPGQPRPAEIHIPKVSDTLHAGNMSIKGNGPVRENKCQDFALMMNISKQWLDVYENELRRVLNIPQLGLTRSYQEHAVHAVEKYLDFQTATLRFVSVLSEPMMQTIHGFPEESGNGSEGLDSKDLYQLWIKKLEAAYMKLLKSPEYISAMSVAIRALRDCRVARQQLLMDMLQEIPVPTNRDMDELYKELYILKNKVKELEKKERRNG